MVRIRGNVHKKTMQGRADDFKPLDVVVHGQAEVLQKCALSILIFVFFSGGNHQETGETSTPSWM